MRFYFFSAIVFILTAVVSSTAQPAKFAWGYRDSTHYYYSNSVINTPGNGFMFYGNNYNTHSGGFIIKTDSAGNVLWNRYIGSTRFVELSSMIVSSDSCFIIVGSTRISNTSHYNILLMKIASNGDSVWSKEIDMSESGYGFDIQQTFDNGFILTGYTNISNAPYHYLLAAKLDSIGNSEWIHKYSDSITGLVGSSIEQTPDSGFLITGTANSSKQFLVKLTNTGTFTWIKTYDAGSFIRNGADIEIMNDGYLCFGTKQNSGILIKTDFSGNVIWNKEYFDMDSFDPHHIYHTHDNGYLMVADTNTSYFGSFLKVDTAGNIIWKRSVTMLTTGIVEAPDNDIVVIGHLGYNLGIIKTDSIDGGIGCLEAQINITATSPVLIVDSLELTATSSGVVNQIYLDASSPFLARDTICVNSPVNISDITIPQWKIFPNPSSGIFSLSTDNFSEKSDIEIYNSVGAIVYNSEINLNEKRIDLSNLAQGIYFLKINTNTVPLSMKIIVLKN
jgi:hypothetical protein